MKLLLIQHGNYAEAYRRFQNGGSETYRDQKASVDYVAKLSDQGPVTTIAITDDVHDIALSPSLRSIGLRYQDLTAQKISNLFDELKPDRLICRTPHWMVLREARRRQTPTLGHFADIFGNKSPKDLYRNLRLRTHLFGKHLACVANHSRNASLSVHKALFVPKSRIVPWDRRVIQAGMAPREFTGSVDAPKLFYAGTLSETKGFGDILRAIQILSETGIRATLLAAGRDTSGPWVQLAQELGISEQVRFAGLMPNDQVLQEMRRHDLVIVSTRHDYAEGLPNTIREALAVRTPLIISDHPAFLGRLRPNQDCLMFAAGQPDDLADAIRRMMSSPGLYRELSTNAVDAVEKLPFGIYWDDMWTFFIQDPRPDAAWIRENSLQVMGL